MKVVVVGYGGRGDVEPGAAVGRELRRRRHDVLLAVPPNMVGFVESTGLTAVPYGPDSREQLNPAMDLVRDVATRGINPMSLLSNVIEHVTKVNRDKTATLTALTDGADVVLASYNEQHLAANVAEYHGISAAALHFFPARIWAPGGMAAAITTEVDGNQRSALGLPEFDQPQPILEMQAYDQLCLPGQAAEWVDPAERRPFVGTLTLELPTDADQEVLRWIAAGAPPVYFGFGSTPLSSVADTIAKVGAACAELGERALICLGANEFGDVPDTGHIKVVDAVNHAAVLPACRAVVHHGGAGTTAAGMRAGIPTLILWLWLDQPIWAAGVEQLGVGTGQPFSATTHASLVAGLRSILAARCTARARELAAQLTPPAKSAALAADLLEQAAGAGRVG
ncbi:glycosyltransferase [Mycobacterium attenuatum]|uniref:glycosyltransferase n=1 Tax=Mycobacterium attenuatum TaxID=2341086 RepID=UPI000F03019C|nr:glycosyltransferase [Mycobacterium attenuatum]